MSVMSIKKPAKFKLISPFTMGLFLLSLLVTLAVILTTVLVNSDVPQKPNILFILADDQDEHMIVPETDLPNIHELIIKQGVTNTNHFCTQAVCCPSRANLWTGRCIHNINVTHVSFPWGGYQKIVDEGINDDYMPIWMQDLGYKTYYAGKLWNDHAKRNYDKPRVKGFDDAQFIIAPGQYKYYDSVFVSNNGTPVDHPGEYMTDIVHTKAVDLLGEALSTKDPWFMVTAPVAPHVWAKVKDGRPVPPPSDPKYDHLHVGYKIPRDEKLATQTNIGAAYYNHSEPWNQTVLDYYDDFQRQRILALQSVDDMVKELIDMVDKAGQLDNTYIFYTSDNGYHVGQHNMAAGKYSGLDVDSRVPMWIKGPGIEPGTTFDDVTTHTDVAATLLALAGGKQRSEFDGSPMPITDSLSKDFAHEPMGHVNIEYWGGVPVEGIYGAYSDGALGSFYRNTFKSLRLQSAEATMYYSVWCFHEHEFYDMSSDPGQMHNLFADEEARKKYKFLDRDFDQLMNRLDAILMVTKSCKTDDCRYPLGALFPDGEVKNLTQAMETQYDKFFLDQPKIRYNRCERGYIIDAEGPQDFNVYGTANASSTR